MNDQEIKNAIRGFLSAWTAGDVKKALSFITEDTVFIGPSGTFKGIAQIEKYIMWVNGMTKDFKVTETGLGIITQGNLGVIEHKLSGTTNGMKWESPAVCIYEFKDGKMVAIRSFYDVLSQSQQAAKGFFTKWVLNTVVNTSQKGLK